METRRKCLEYNKEVIANLNFRKRSTLQLLYSEKPLHLYDPVFCKQFLRVLYKIIMLLCTGTNIVILLQIDIIINAF